MKETRFKETEIVPTLENWDIKHITSQFTDNCESDIRGLM